MSLRYSMQKNNDRWFIAIILALISFFVMVSLSSCSRNEVRSPLHEQILRPRTGYKGLTNKACLEYDWRGKCKNEETVDYNLYDKSVRAMLIDFGFRCKIAGRRFKIDPDKPGFARYEWKRDCFLCSKEPIIVERISIDEYQYLIEANTQCYSEDAYPDGLH